MSSLQVPAQKITEGVISTAGVNTTVWYRKDSPTVFSVNGSFEGLETPFDWVLVKPIDTRYVKSGVISFNSNKKSLNVTFKTPFDSSDYYVFFLSNNSVNLWWSDKRKDRFTINGSDMIGDQVTWLAIEKKIKLQTGIKMPGTVFVGSRVIMQEEATWDGDKFPDDEIFDREGLPMPPAVEGELPPDCAINLNGWFQNEYIIKPNLLRDGIRREMNFGSSSFYSVLLSANNNINTFWLEKGIDRVKIGTSYPLKTTIDYLFIKAGLNWWDEV